MGLHPDSREDYRKVNAAINEVFFSAENDGRPVYLDLEDHAKAKLARRLSALVNHVSVNDVEAVIGIKTAETLDFSRGNPYRWHLDNLQEWDQAGRQAPPPFTAVLCALSIAAEHMRQDEKFGSNNYYERLFQVLGVESSTSQQKLKQNANTTRMLWRALNQWLASNDYVYGRPTAQPVNKWKHVSFALSQALVRDADRKRFRDMFRENQLSPREQVSEGEMLLLVAEWMTGTGPSSWLKRIWAEPDLRERIALAAVTELSNWDGDLDAEDGSALPSKRLTLTGALSSFPSPRLELYLSASAADPEAAGTLQLDEGGTQNARRAFEHCEEDTWLSMAPGADFAILEPTRNIELAALLLDSFKLVSKKNGTSYLYDARAIIPMVKLDDAPYFRSASRVSLLRNHLVLCQHAWQDRVQAHIESYARPGFKVHASENLPGFLAPDLQRAILAGEQPPGLNLETLMRSPMPVAWGQQATMIETLGV